MKIAKSMVLLLALFAGRSVAGACKSTGNTGVCSNLMIQYAHFREDGIVEIKLQDRETREVVDTSILLDAKRVGDFRFAGMYPIVQTALPTRLTIWLSYTVKDGRHYLDEILAYQPDIAL